MIYLLLFFLGIFIGSFLNVLIDRLPRNEGVVTGRSYCESCRHVLSGIDLIPLVSFLLLQGKCRYCHVRLSFYYPGVELLTGILFVFAALQGNVFIPTYDFFYTLFILSCFIVVFFADLKYGIIPDQIIFAATVVTFLSLSIPSPLHAIPYFLSAVGSLLFFLFLFLATNGRGMGFGDVKLAFFLGLFLGFPKIIICLYIAFLLGAVIGVGLIATKKKKLRGGIIYFGPFLILGALISMYWGDVVQSWFYILTL